jgi:Tol biopolymer transport system component
MAILGCGAGSACGAGTGEARGAGLSGVFLVCKEYGTVRGTFLTNVRGRDITRLNYLFGEGVDPRLSPSDERVLFTSTRGGTPGLWTMNRQGEEQKRICDGDQGDWFPDGRQILFRRQGQIMRRSLDTGQETLLSPAGWTSCSSPACAPDGRRILFVTRDGGQNAICRVALGKPEPRRLIEGEILGAPRWSPDGERIVYQSGAHLWLVDAAGSNQRQLTTGGGIQRRPAWSPDGAAIVYCQGPGHQGPWQMAAISSDGTRKYPISQGDARSVLCADWGVEQPNQKPAPHGTAAGPAPRVRLWGIDRPMAAAPTDWAAFCRARQGWNAIPAENALGPGPRGGCVVENDNAVLILLVGTAGAVLVPKPALTCAVEFALLDARGQEAGPIESVSVRSCGPDAAALESSSHSAVAPAKAAWAIGGSRALVRMTPLENVSELRAAVPLQCVVVPDRFGNDIVADPEAFGEGRVLLPWSPLVAGFLGNGSDMLVLICPEQGQNVELRKETGLSFAGADVACQNRGVSAGVVTGERVWHLERFGAEGPAEPRRFRWSMPCAAHWRLAVQGGRQRYAALFSDKESALFDKKAVLIPKNSEFAATVRLGVIYLYGRTVGTPPESPTPMDLLRDALGLKAAQQVLDEDGLTGYRRAAGPTTWAELSVTIASLRYLFERQLEVQDGAYARHLCDDLLPFVEGMDQRLKEYADFARELETLCQISEKPSPAAAQVLDDLAAVSQQLRELGARQRGLSSVQELRSLCTKIKQLTAQESSENRKQLEQCCQGLLEVVGPREELLRAYRKLAVGARDAAGIAPLTQAKLLGPAEKIRTLCQRVLRNRFYSEAGWRGEDYKVPAFWLGPRPYE